MKKIATIALLLLAATFNNAVNAQSKNTKDKQQIETVIATYTKALSTADATLAASLYTKNAKFMPQGGPSAVGTENIKGSYSYVFSLLTPTIEFTIDEVVFVGKIAYVTSTSKGTSLIKANNQNVPEINRELFIFEKENGAWKIARYIFNKMSN
jgi:uncharacterized protein (TIGR02246 family)